MNTGKNYCFHVLYNNTPYLILELIFNFKIVRQLKNCNTHPMTANQNSIPKQDLEIIKQLYSAINRNDVENFIDLLDSNIFRIEFEDSTYRGQTELRQNFLSGRSNWAEGACEPVEFFLQGNKIVVDAHVKVRLKNESKWIDAHVADVFSIHAGRVAEFHSFATKQKAFEWATTHSP